MGSKARLRYECPSCGKKHAGDGFCGCRIKLRRIRTGKSKVLWTGEENGRAIRAIAVDQDTNHSVPCLIVFERGIKSVAGGRTGWMSLTGMSASGDVNNLEATLAYELGKALGTLPEWAQED